MKILLLSSITLVLAGLACGRQEPPKVPVAPSAPVRLVQEASISQPGWVAVTLNATQRATLATRLAASVKKVLVTEGQHVAAGALLVSLSDEDLQSGRKAAETAVAAADTQFHRIEKLASQDAATQAELDTGPGAVGPGQGGPGRCAGQASAIPRSGRPSPGWSRPAG